MTTRIIQKLILISLLTLSASVFADDTSSSTSKYFGGWYGGVQLGGGRNEAKITDKDGWDGGNNDQCGPTTPCSFKINGSGGLAGLVIGYDHIVGSQLIGLLAEGSISNIDANKLTTLNSGATPTYTIKSEINGLGSLRAKYGYTKDKFAIFVTGGLGFADTTSKFKDVYDPSDRSRDSNIFDRSKFNVGTVYGIGAAFAVTDASNISIDYSRYSFNNSSDYELGTTSCSFGVKDIEVETAKITYVIKF